MSTTPLDPADEPVELPPLRPPLHNTSSPGAGEPVVGHVSIEALRVWYEERAERRLRGEWESAARSIVELLEDARTTPARLTAVRITAPYTSQSFLSSLLGPYLRPPPASPPTLTTVLRQTRDITQTLLLTSAFTSLQPTLVRSYHPLALPSDLELHILARERPRLFLKGGTDLGNTEASASITARVFNALGHAESASVVLSTGTRTRRAYEATVEGPLVGLARALGSGREEWRGQAGWELATRGEGTVWASERDWGAWAGCWVGEKGGRVGVRTRSPYGTHALSYSLTSRAVHSLAPSASLTTRLAAGPSTKSSLAHTLTHTTSRTTFRLTQELAGLGGDARFLRLEADYATVLPVTSSITASLTARSALLRPLGATPTLLPDRLFLGGPTSVRMFRQNRMGPHDGPYATGGEIALSTGLSLLGPLPGTARTWPLQWHLFLNAGSLGRLLPGDATLPAVRSTLARPSVTAGLGLVLRIEPVRVEANVGVPLVAAAGEGTRRGLQVGVGLEFL